MFQVLLLLMLLCTHIFPLEDIHKLSNLLITVPRPFPHQMASFKEGKGFAFQLNEMSALFNNEILCLLATEIFTDNYRKILLIK